MISLDLTNTIWSKADAATVSPDGKLLVRIDDRWFVADEYAAS